ncbi:hypothetical protein [Leucothrix arctica]|uniref:Lectin n=1 Tax=Leucothrix arctica TaxID=1481894 RepID=A0A317CPS6_9GAMM|nr:hypothetical protein [Leucothrix arctica]PWQ98312.1 hypothetical protein DKT75_04045 [Leucothrix arctica]
MKLSIVLALSIAAVTAGSIVQADSDSAMSFFVTSEGSGKGGDLGGLEGADKHCTTLAESAGVKGKGWKAYLSTQEEGKRGVSARDRIGTGPWHNAKGELIATNLDDLHISPNIFKTTALNENGELVNGRGDAPNKHDLLTGSMSDGTAYFPTETADKTCSNWTSSDKGSATVGHHDRHGGGNTSWNSAHGSRGCSPEALTTTGGTGLFMCFAVAK